MQVPRRKENIEEIVQRLKMEKEKTRETNSKEPVGNTARICARRAAWCGRRFACIIGTHPLRHRSAKRRKAVWCGRGLASIIGTNPLGHRGAQDRGGRVM